MHPETCDAKRWWSLDGSKHGAKGRGSHMRRKMEKTATAYNSHDSIANAVRLIDILNTQIE